MKVTDKKSIGEAVLIATLSAIGTGLVNFLFEKLKKEKEKKKNATT